MMPTQASKLLISLPTVVETADGEMCFAHGSFIVDHQEAYRVIEYLLNFYDSTPAFEIEQHNSNVYTNHKDDKPMYGYVYLVKRGDGLYKIGKSLDVDTRIQSLRRKHGPVELIHFIECENYDQAEVTLHTRYRSKWVKAEWFALTPDDVTEIKAIARMDGATC